MRMLYRSKIHQATVTAADVRYVGSITIDAELIELAGFWEWEKVLVVSNTSGARLETYIIAGEKGSGAIEMNGAAAHLIKAGEEVIIIGFELTEKPIDPTAILVDEKNRFVRFLSHPGDRPTKDPAAQPRKSVLV
ncbi:MAG: aspartate 1-decarboxylase [Deltaproteobacteria bacterium]|nr:aspartate 1-decarboxylase [Deltaproteobacteria bacterium]